MASIINKLKSLFRFKGEGDIGSADRATQSDALIGVQTTAVLNESTVLDLMRTIEETDPEMYDCETTFALLDEYVDLVSSDAEKAALMPLVEKHLEVCPKCRSQFEILMQILQVEGEA